MRGLIVTADDFGLATEVNRAVAMAHEYGVLTAASLMVSAPAADEAVAMARAAPTLRVGLHLVLVEGRPTLPPSRIPALVGADGLFREDMLGAAISIFLRRGARRQLAAEIAAQFEAFRATGLSLDHLTVHKHFHLHPTIAGLALRIGRDFGLRAVRLPVEPRATIAEAEPGRSIGGEWATQPWARLARRRFRAAGMLAPDQVFGLRWSGAMTPARLAGLAARLPPGLSEIYLHPATDARFEGAAPGYRYAEELAALVDPALARAMERAGLRRGGFCDFLPEGRWDA